jgi:hypothetical protein
MRRTHNRKDEEAVEVAEAEALRAVPEADFRFCLRESGPARKQEAVEVAEAEAVPPVDPEGPEVRPRSS